MQDLALYIFELPTSGLNLLIQPVQIPLQSLPALQQINTPSNSALSLYLPIVHLVLSCIPSIQVLNENASNNEPWETLLVSGLQMNLTPFTTTLRLAIQPVFYP